MNTSKKKIVPLTKENYLAVIRNSVGTKMFRQFYAEIDGEKTDIMRGGELSRAFYVSSILKMFDLIGRIHGTVDSTAKDLREFGWKPNKTLSIGDIIVWEVKTFDNNESHKHIGFYVGKNKTVSNSDKIKSPVIHDLGFEQGRKIELILSLPPFK